jgi:hypothetical protein
MKKDAAICILATAVVNSGYSKQIEASSNTTQLQNWCVAVKKTMFAAKIFTKTF